MSDAEFTLSESEWRDRLSKDAYRVLREQGTEPRFSGEHVDRSDDGVYRCVGCGAELFTSDTKYDSHCGWPSFYAANDSNIELRRDLSHGMDRTEVVCSSCGGHLGHVFDDGPQPTGKRYCINSVVLDFDPDADDA
ncbi:MULTISPECIES: peptide-methionine (R)-S-oxide reductase MsrB [Haloferax]|uniref:peptide-methionine (R)-S-oxide reductase n=2 Tax=Haloferax TaxID=2251 RepID=A0A6G1Z177_9EURY|nr:MULTISPECIES: peptide-methionine (R)-S-oxide reductase MsrB [Haloferax]KAB1187613.1 peptide-methionine (R)-S-oxide reductase MsrB [Haloferax sp. CBA1149]MRW80272.1 peptide-methionine (R)-S-oxide reductase MsrB [Haloferax marinisediminis]